MEGILVLTVIRGGLNMGFPYFQIPMVELLGRPQHTCDLQLQLSRGKAVEEEKRAMLGAVVAACYVRTWECCEFEPELQNGTLSQET